MDGRNEESRKEGRMGGWMEGMKKVGRKDGWMDGRNEESRKEGRMGGWMEGRKEG